MPAAIIPAAIGATGSISSGVGGKKAQKSANAAAQQQLQLQQGMYGKANEQLGPASNYWQSLLKGGQAAVQATGPIASQIGQGAAGARTAIQATTPRGGEQNLAMAQNYNSSANNIARLYAGMQPLAAQGLTGIGGAYLGGAQPNVGGSLANYLGQQQMAGQGASGFGSLLYNSLNKLNKGKGGGSGMGGKDYGSLGDFAAAGAPPS